jgi:hypothetical protein
MMLSNNIYVPTVHDFLYSDKTRGLSKVISVLTGREELRECERVLSNEDYTPRLIRRFLGRECLELRREYREKQEERCQRKKKCR